MAVIGTRLTVRSQLANSGRFAAAFDYLDACFDPNSPTRARIDRMALGEKARVELAGGAFALLEVYRTRPRAESRWETHVAHIDVQTLVEGTEAMDIAPRERLKPAEDLRPERDVILYEDYLEGSPLVFHPGDVGVYFPPDAHRGALALGASALVRKVVVKVPVIG